MFQLNTRNFNLHDENYSNKMNSTNFALKAVSSLTVPIHNHATENCHII